MRVRHALSVGQSFVLIAQVLVICMKAESMLLILKRAQIVGMIIIREKIK